VIEMLDLKKIAEGLVLTLAVFSMMVGSYLFAKPTDNFVLTLLGAVIFSCGFAVFLLWLTKKPKRE